jgi:23S rRNA pseudouridine2605 synthase
LQNIHPHCATFAAHFLKAMRNERGGKRPPGKFSPKTNSPRNSGDAPRGRRPLRDKPFEPGDDRRPKRSFASDRDEEKRPERDQPFERGDERRPKRSFTSNRNEESRPKRDKPFEPRDNRRPGRPYSSNRSEDRPPMRDKPFEPRDNRQPGRPYSSDSAEESRTWRDKPFAPKDDKHPQRPYSSDARTEGHRKTFDGSAPRKPYRRRDDEFEDKRDKKSFRGNSQFDRPAKKFRDTEYRPKTFKEPSAKSNPDEIRLNKYIAATGRCSRREADELITAGLVMINGEVVTTLGTKVKPGDDVRFDGERIRPEKQVYVLMNKPKDVITTSDDPQGRRTVLDLIGNKIRERLYPVGRLDRNTTGVLLLTNDGEMAKKLTHPRYEVEKIYRVLLDKPVTKADMEQLKKGVELEDGLAAADDVNYADDSTSKKEVGISLHSGRNRVVRRMFEALGYEVIKLDRVSFAGLTKKMLERGHWRFLKDVEVARLKMTTKS